ncbi:MAG: DUF1223 domain-containing protein [Pseudolabrys sp.]|nr:DUF1223 domain-containing protein [Pseudolabrys sp.]MDP2297315.1 DUF1223 domain-containing protein [Pseudolabrys sp.]
MNNRGFTYLAALVCAAVAAATAARAGEPRAVIELFTSQGCSSCPPADKLLGELANDPSLLTMTLPVDYWDYLGWKDTLANQGHSKRQRAYSLARGDRDVYTPQAVINGVVHVLGSDRAAIEKAIAQTKQSAQPLAVPVTLKIADGKATVTVAAAGNDTDGKSSGEIWLCPITNSAPVVIGRGENKGRTLTYHNVVRRWVKLGDWTGKAETFSVALSELPGNAYALDDIDQLAVVLQSGVAAKPGVMLGAAQARLR